VYAKKEQDRPMSRYGPQSQTHALMRQKEELARRLLAQGLTVTQICQQLRCSPYFVRQVRDHQPVRADPAATDESMAG
jgi:hypothetical protein